MNRINVHYIIKKPTREKLIDLINREMINNQPLFIYTIHNDNSNIPSSELFEFVNNGESYYFFANNIKKTLIYNIDMIPTIPLENSSAIFITNLLHT